jgi:general secretion pathway protein A
MSLLSAQEFASAFVFNPRLNTTEFLQFVMMDFGVNCAETKAQNLQLLNKFLIDVREQRRTAVLIVDEAQHLPEEVLEEIRLLTNLESADEKLLQIVLAGQPELEDKLDSMGLRQLKQRVAVRCRLEPLDEQATGDYIYRRLEQAGCARDRARSMFRGDVIQAIHRYSNGIPRLVNVICDNALIAAYGRGTQEITAASVKEIAGDLRLGICSSRTTQPSNEANTVKLLLRLLDAFEQHGPRKDFNTEPFGRPV